MVLSHHLLILRCYLLWSATAAAVAPLSQLLLLLLLLLGFLFTHLMLGCPGCWMPPQ
jgi:hypothetical protein